VKGLLPLGRAHLQVENVHFVVVGCCAGDFQLRFH